LTPNARACSENRTTLGFSREKLGSISAFVKSRVDDGKLPGDLCLVSRCGEEAHFLSYGKARRRARHSDETCR